MLFKLSFLVGSLAGVSSAVVSTRNITGKAPLQQIHPVQGSGVLKVPVTKKDPTGVQKRQDFENLLNVYNGYLITSMFQWLLRKAHSDVL
jgi:hypothetical protein